MNDLPELLDGDEIHQRVIHETMMRARENVWIATANVKDCRIELDGAFRSIVDAFCQLCQRGVEVRLLHSAIPSGMFLESLKATELTRHPSFKMRRCLRVHFKAILVDDAWLYLGSANLTGAGLGAKSGPRRNFELGMLFSEPAMSERVARLYHSIWDGLHCDDCGRRNICYAPLEEPE